MLFEAGGHRIHYDINGPDGAPVVFMSHSLGSSSVMWDPQMPALTARYRVVRFDTRGHGGSDAPAGAYSLEGLEDDAIGLIESLGIAPLHWVGLSMGGMIGQGVALRRPDLLRSLALCDTAAAIPAEARAMWDQRIAAAESNGMAALVDATMERWFTGPYLAGSAPGLGPIRDQFLATPVAGFAGCCHAIRDLAYLDRLSAIACPSLVIVGADDMGTPVAAAQAMHAQISGSKLVVLPSAAHLANVEQADLFTEALLAHLEAADV